MSRGSGYLLTNGMEYQVRYTTEFCQWGRGPSTCGIVSDFVVDPMFEV